MSLKPTVHWTTIQQFWLVLKALDSTTTFLSYFRPTKFKAHYVAPQFFIFRWTVQIAPNFLHWNVHVSLWLIPNSIIVKTTLRLLPIPYSLVPASAGGPPLTPSPPFILSQTEELVSVPMTGMRYTSLLWMCTLNTLT